MAGPKLFVSYSWTNPDHEARVIQLSTDLCESGVDVILDKWNLKEGHDAHAFMEKMVTDPEIKKVILICDKGYVEKANDRRAGVGTEAQIISVEIYEKQEQDKFVAIVIERDEQGKAYLPAYYSSRIYIDLSDPSKHSENFERLIRWVYDQPLYTKPEIGEKPAFLSEEQGAVALATTSRAKRAVDALRNSRDHAIPATTEYLALLSKELEKLRINSKENSFDDAVVRSIESFLPYRNETIELFLNLSIYRDTLETRIAVHRFFEQLISYLEPPQQVHDYSEVDFDNFRFIIHELFLYALACFIRNERFESAAYVMSNDYYVPGRSEYGRDIMVPFNVFHKPMRSLEDRNQRLKMNLLSLRADLLKQRCKGIGIEFRHIMQVDFILFLRSYLDRPDGFWRWWPETLLYVDRHSGAFEVFARSRSASYFDRAKVLLGITAKDELQPLIEYFSANERTIPRWQFESFNPSHLLGFNEIATKP